jgi:hypothetical protein
VGGPLSSCPRGKMPSSGRTAQLCVITCTYVTRPTYHVQTDNVSITWRVTWRVTYRANILAPRRPRRSTVEEGPGDVGPGRPGRPQIPAPTRRHARRPGDGGGGGGGGGDGGRGRVVGRVVAVDLL